MATAHRCGWVALMGPPNAGKSTLTNALVGQKVAIVTAKPQTTRNRIVGILTQKDAQVIFMDTPGVHALRGQTRGQLGKIMVQSAWQSFAVANCTCASPISWSAISRPSSSRWPKRSAPSSLW